MAKLADKDRLLLKAMQGDLFQGKNGDVPQAIAVTSRLLRFILVAATGCKEAPSACQSDSK